MPWTWAGARRSPPDSPSRPVTGLVLGGSLSNGAFLTRALTDTLGTTGQSGRDDQTAAGFDAEYSRGHLVLRAEGDRELVATAAVRASVPSRTRCGRSRSTSRGATGSCPGLYVAIRVDRLDFSEVCGTIGCLPWDAPVRRVEAGGGYSIRRNVVLKGAYQYNWRDGVRHPRLGLAAAQLLVWF